MSLAVVNAAEGGSEAGTSASSQSTGTLATTAGNAILVFIRYGTGTLTAVTDTIGNTYTKLTAASGTSGNTISTWLCRRSSATNASNVVTAGNGTTDSFAFASTHAIQLNGEALVEVQDFTHGTSAAPTSSSITTHYANEVALSIASYNSGTSLSAPVVGSTSGTIETTVSGDTNTKTSALALSSIQTGVTDAWTGSASAAWQMATVVLKSPVGILQSASAFQTGVASKSVTLPLPTKTGNTLVAAVSWGSRPTVGQVNPTSVDDGTNTFTLIASTLQTLDDRTVSGGAGNYDRIGSGFWAIQNAAGLTTDTVTLSFGSNICDMGITVYELAPSVPDQVGIGTSGTTQSSSAVSSSMTPVASNEVCLSCVTEDDGFGTAGVVAGTGYTLDSTLGGGNLEAGNAHQLQGSPAAVTGAFTLPRNGTWTSSQVSLLPTIAIIQSRGAPTDGQPFNNPNAHIQLQSRCIAGDTLLMVFGGGSVGSSITFTVTGVTDTDGNTWTVLPAGTANILATNDTLTSTIGVQIAIATNIKGTPVGSLNEVTMAFNDPNYYGSAWLWELSPCTADQEIAGTGTLSTSSNSYTESVGPITPSTAGALIVGISQVDFNGASVTIGTGYTPGSGWTEDMDTGMGGFAETADHILQKAASAVTFNPVLNVSAPFGTCTYAAAVGTIIPPSIGSTGGAAIAGTVAAQSSTSLQLKSYLGALLSAGQSSTSATVSTKQPLTLSTPAATSTATVILKTYLGALSSAGQSSATATVTVPSGTSLPLSAVAGQSNATATVTVPGAANLSLSTVAGQSNATASLFQGFLGSITSSAQSNVTGTVSTKQPLAFGSVAATSTAALALQPYIGQLTSAGQSSASAVLSLPVRLPLAASNATSTATATFTAPHLTGAVLNLFTGGTSSVRLAVRVHHAGPILSTPGEPILTHPNEPILD